MSVVALLAASVVVALTGSGLFRSDTTPTPAATALADSGRGTKGSPDAPVTVIEYSDFQCPACGFFAQWGALVDKEYVETGKVRFIYRHYAFLGPESTWAAEAAECAGDQGRFWAYHDKLFAGQAGENKGAFSKEKLKQFAAELALEQGEFDACIDSGRHASRVEADRVEAEERGVRATPTFFINGRMIEGAPRDFASFRAVIDAELGATE
jgi:protein-disulfide isomerase